MTGNPEVDPRAGLMGCRFLKNLVSIGPESGNIVSGVFTPVLSVARATRSFNRRLIG
jgi:hypothetical protein